MDRGPIPSKNTTPIIQLPTRRGTSMRRGRRSWSGRARTPPSRRGKRTWASPRRGTPTRGTRYLLSCVVRFVWGCAMCGFWGVGGAGRRVRHLQWMDAPVSLPPLPSTHLPKPLTKTQVFRAQQIAKWTGPRPDDSKVPCCCFGFGSVRPSICQPLLYIISKTPRPARIHTQHNLTIRYTTQTSPRKNTHASLLMTSTPPIHNPHNPQPPPTAPRHRGGGGDARHGVLPDAAVRGRALGGGLRRAHVPHAGADLRVLHHQGQGENGCG